MAKRELTEQIFDEYKLIAVIISAAFSKDGIEFFTPNNFSQQLAYMKRPAGYKIQEHLHRPVFRNVKYTLETLFVRKGRVRLDFYSESKKFLQSRELHSGDVVLLVSGGHGLEMLEESEIVEVKQGPYTGDEDKERFLGEREK
jgi:hypothetical protein